MTRYHRIFAALDGGPTQRAVARRAISLAHNNQAALCFGHVIDSVPYEVNGIDFAALAQEGREHIEADLAEELAKARSDSAIPDVQFSVSAGRVAETLIEVFIEPFNPDLIVCGVRGLSTIKYAFVGSVSTSLIRNADCDVLVVRPEGIDEGPFSLTENN